MGSSAGRLESKVCRCCGMYPYQELEILIVVRNQINTLWAVLYVDSFSPLFFIEEGKNEIAHIVTFLVMCKLRTTWIKEDLFCA